MQRIEKLSKNKNQGKGLRILSLTSSIAASLLIGLFVFEQYFPSINTEDNSSITNLYICKSDNYIEKPTALSEFNQLMQMKKERQKLYANLVNKYKNL
jgi:predicted type IV restriction endonuclease